SASAQSRSLVPNRSEKTARAIGSQARLTAPWTCRAPNDRVVSWLSHIGWRSARSPGGTQAQAQPARHHREGKDFARGAGILRVLDGEIARQCRERHLHFEDRQRAARAEARAGAEMQERLRAVSLAGALARSEPALRLELPGILVVAVIEA